MRKPHLATLFHEPGLLEGASFSCAPPPCLSQPKRDGQTLLTQVWRRLNLTECDYFGLEFQHPRAYWVRALASLLQTGCGYVVGAGDARGHGKPRRTYGSNGSTEPDHRAVTGAVPWKYGVHVPVS